MKQKVLNWIEEKMSNRKDGFSMIVTTISKSHINSISLPDKVKGQFWLYETSDTGVERLVNIEGVIEEWIMNSTRQV